MEGSIRPTVIVEDSLDDLLRAGFSALLDRGRPVVDSSRGPNTELPAVTLQLSNPRARLSRTESRGKAVSALAELLWYASGSASPAVLSHYVRYYGDHDDDLDDAYGPRLFGENQTLRAVAGLLSERPSTRRAVVPIIRADDLRSKDMPCTCDLQFLARDDVVEMIAHLRSSDAYRGFVHDVFCFTMLQELVSRELGLEPGPYTHIAGSYHLYDDNRADAQRFLEEGLQWDDPMPPMPDGPQWAYLDGLVRHAERLRESGGHVDPDDSLPGFWGDLGLLLSAYELGKAGRYDEIGGLRQRLQSGVLAVYLDDRMERGR